MTPRTIDRLVAAGNLVEIKLGARRSAITGESLDKDVAIRPRSKLSEPEGYIIRRTLLILMVEDGEPGAGERSTGISLDGSPDARCSSVRPSS